MNEEVIVTEDGYQELEKRLDYLKFTMRPQITDRIKIARDFGDLSENAEYDAAKNEQGRIEGEIAEIEAKLKVAKIVISESRKRALEKRVKELSGKNASAEDKEEKLRIDRVLSIAQVTAKGVSVGKKVKVYDTEMDEETDYEIVGTTEADLSCGRISNESPLGAALLGKEEGDVVTVHAPGGDYQLKVVKVY